jgi:hypothetical protein
MTEATDRAFLGLPLNRRRDEVDSMVVRTPS